MILFSKSFISSLSTSHKSLGVMPMRSKAHNDSRVLLVAISSLSGILNVSTSVIATFSTETPCVSFPA